MSHSHTVSSIVSLGEDMLESANLCYYHGTDNPLDEAIMLVSFILDWDLSKVEIDDSYQLTKEQEKRAIELFQKRISSKKPAPLLTNISYFAGRKYYVDERVMVPRSPFAEIINNKFSPWLNHNKLTNVLDLCTGSGAISIATALEVDEVNIDASDISKEALDVANINIQNFNLSHKINLIESNLFDKIDRKYDLILSNPPYVSEYEYDNLPKEFSYEPKIAFTSNNDGLAITEEILKKAYYYLNNDGILMVEVGAYAGFLEEFFPKVPFTWVDLANGGEGVFVFSKEELMTYFSKI